MNYSKIMEDGEGQWRKEETSRTVEYNGGRRTVGGKRRTMEEGGRQ